MVNSVESFLKVEINSKKSFMGQLLHRIHRIL